MVRYEWLVEEVDEHGDIIDTYTWDTASAMFDAMRESIAAGLCYHFGIVRDTVRDDGELIDRQWAYAENGKLPDEFDGGAKVPKRMVTEFAAAA